jgi:hypothetical protein
MSRNIKFVLSHVMIYSFMLLIWQIVVINMVVGSIAVHSGRAV